MGKEGLGEGPHAPPAALCSRRRRDLTFSPSWRSTPEEEQIIKPLHQPPAATEGLEINWALPKSGGGEGKAAGSILGWREGSGMANSPW